MASTRSYTLNVWRQNGPEDKGHFEEIKMDGVSPDQSFLEMMDMVNQKLIKAGKEPIVFDHDCREGICGACSMVVDGNPHGPDKATTTCQLHMRTFADGARITIEPFRAKSFPVIKDLMVDRSSFDKIIEAGGYISARTGSAQDANAIPISKENADRAFSSAACIGCGACVAACANSSAMLFTSAKITHLSLLPQGEPEHCDRVLKMVKAMDDAGFGNCSNTGACALACPKEISLENIAVMNREYLKSSLKHR